MIAKEKARSRCGACHKLGHWAGDPECSKSSNAGPKKHGSKSGSKGRGKRSGGKAYLVSEEPLFFTLGDVDEDYEAFCSMVKGDEEDLKRKTKEVQMFSEDEDGWSQISSTVSGYPKKETSGKEDAAETRKMPVITEDAKVTVMKVADIDAIRPKMDGLTVRQLQDLCDEWGVKHTGSKAEIQRRLQTFYMGVPVHKAGCSKQFVMLEEAKPDDKSLRKSPAKKSREESQTASASKDVPSASESGRSFRIQGKSSPDKTSDKGSGIFRSDSSKNEKEKAYFCWASADSDGKKEEVPQAPQADFQRPPINVGEVLPLVCLVEFVSSLCWSVRTGLREIFSLAAPCLVALDVASLCAMMKDLVRRGRGPFWPV